MRIRRAIAVLSSVGALITIGGIFAGPALASSVPNPAVQGPIGGGLRGYAWNHSLFPLSGPGFSYTENEYFYGGAATDLSTGAQAPYESRMLVRLPSNPDRFNGTVVVEWLNVTGQSDLETTWPVEAQYLMQHGYGYVGVSAQLAGVCCGPTTLKGWDPVRYAPLVHPSDRFSYDIFSQAIQALRDPRDNRAVIGGAIGVDPMQGMKVQHIVANGASQSASQLTSFVNGGYNRGGIDAYVITRGGGPYNDFSTPIFQLNEETVGQVNQPDNPHYRLWEEAGTAHAPYVWWSYVWQEDRRDVTGPAAPDPLNTACSVNRGSVDYSARALSDWVERYLDTGQMPPSMPRLERDSSGNVVRDANGLAEAGVRQPFVQVPVAYNAGSGCPLWGTYRPWTPAKIQSLYATHDAYVSAVQQAAEYDVGQGWLRPEDGADAVAKAQAFTAPWQHGSCYDTYNETGNESGPVSSQVAAASWNPALLTVGQTVPLGGAEAAVHEANCDVVVKAGG
ncbi:MAG TPA: alpha/beta hydrolase domain-containing protein [Solirubrobacteraceae bacterium]|nr:alpha/beta hydrolase domain-containing protein [Solirubrobacteraceae bacterium]